MFSNIAGLALTTVLRVFSLGWFPYDAVGLTPDVALPE